jgi:FkbM family methyltransferase
MPNNEISQKIIQYYRDILKREPDKEGFQHYLEKITSKEITLNDLKIIFENSDEFKTLKTMQNIDQIPIETKDGLIMYLNPTDRNVSYLIFTNKEHEPFETLILKYFLQKNSVYVDIGANIGYFSLIAGSIAKNGKVFSFEPYPLNFELLEKNIIANNFANIQTFQYAVSNQNTFVDIFSSDANKGNVRLFKNDLEGYMEEHQLNKLVKCTTLDTILDDSIDPDIIKMDIQGGEMLALKGMKKIIQKTNELVLFTEFWPEAITLNKESPAEFLQLLQDLDFEIYDIDINKNKLIKKSNTQLLEDYPIEKYMAQTNLLCLKNTSLPTPLSNLLI